MATTERATVIGVFEDHTAADRAVAELHRAGFRNDQIGVAGRDHNAGSTGTTTDKGSHVLAGAATGVAVGAGAGGLAALGILAGVIPGIGPAIAAGTLGMILANAAGGAAIAGIAGALIGLGIPEDEAQHYEEEFKAGRTIVTVKDLAGRDNEAWAILQRNGGYSKQMPKGTSTASSAKASSYGTAGSAMGAQTKGGKTMQLHEEQLHAQKQSVQAGEVRVRKEVVTENKSFEVPVTREEVVVERRTVNKAGASSSDMRPGEEIRIPVKEEQVRVTKDTIVKEEVNVGKRQVQGTEKVSGTVRKEEVKIEQKGKVDVNTEKNRR